MTLRRQATIKPTNLEILFIMAKVYKRRVKSTSREGKM
jgi:hypothetical protein